MVGVFTFLSFQRWFFQVIAMVITALMIPGLKITSILGPMLAVLALAFINTHLWSAALFFQFPDSLSYHAMLLLCANALVFWILVKILPGIEVKGIIPVFLAPVVFSLLSIFIEAYGATVNWPRLGADILELISSVRDYFLQEQSIPTGS